jgi:hypothetical protein
MSKNDKKYTYKTLVMSNDINWEGPGVGCSRFQVPGSRFQVPGSRFQVPGSRFQVPGSRFQVLCLPICQLPTAFCQLVGSGFQVPCLRPITDYRLPITDFVRRSFSEGGLPNYFPIIKLAGNCIVSPS